MVIYCMLNNPFIRNQTGIHEFPPPEYFDEVKRVSRNQIIWGVNYFNYDFTGGRIVWDKLNGDTDQYDCEIAYCSMNDRTDLIYCMWRGMIQGTLSSKETKN